MAKLCPYNKFKHQLLRMRHTYVYVPHSHGMPMFINQQPEKLTQQNFATSQHCLKSFRKHNLIKVRDPVKQMMLSLSHHYAGIWISKLSWQVVQTFCCFILEASFSTERVKVDTHTKYYFSSVFLSS